MDRVLDELIANGKRPSVLCAENVVGFLSAARGTHFKAAYRALRDRGYLAGAVVWMRAGSASESAKSILVAADTGLPLRDSRNVRHQHLFIRVR